MPQCQHLITRGDKKGNVCGQYTYKGANYCYHHKHIYKTKPVEELTNNNFDINLTMNKLLNNMVEITNYLKLIEKNTKINNRGGIEDLDKILDDNDYLIK